LERTLRRHDVVAMAERRRRNLVTTSAFEGCRCCYDPNGDGGEYRALMEYKEQHPVSGFETNNHTIEEEEENQEPNGSPHDDNDDDDDDDEFDYLLDDDLPGMNSDVKELEENRRAELEFQMLTRLVAIQHGFGTHRQLHPGRVLKAAGLGENKSRQPPPAVVLHLVDPDSIASASLDYYLETSLAPQTPGTVFMRSGGRSTLLMDAAVAQKTALGVLRPDQDMPALIAIRDGVVVNVCPNLRGLTLGEDSPIDEHAVQRWLDGCGVLRSQAPSVMEELCHIRPEEDALMDYMATKKLQNQNQPQLERYDCGLGGCNKAFKHEHVGVKTSEQDGLVVKEETVLGQDE
jgi:hypothetical protein